MSPPPPAEGPARIIFMGTPEFAVPSLTALAQQPQAFRVVGVVTRPDKPAGRGRRLVPPPVKVAAESLGVPVRQPPGVKKPVVQDELAALQPDLIIVAAYGRILPPAVLSLPHICCVNVHASLLPRHRGASPIAHTILAGDREAGISIMQMDPGLDTGPVFLREPVLLTGKETCGSLTERLAKVGARALLDVLPEIVRGDAVAEPQDNGAATQAPLLRKADGLLDFRRPAEQLERQVRAFFPWPTTFATKGDTRIQVLSASVTQTSGPARPGTILVAGSHGVVVACGRDGLCLEQVKPAGRKAIRATAWVAGRGAQVGERFELPEGGPVSPGE